MQSGARALAIIALLAAIAGLPVSVHAVTVWPSVDRPSPGRLTPDSTLGDLLHHPAFAGFAPLLLPWDDRSYDEAMALRDVGSLLPFHNEVRPPVVVRSLDRMIDDIGAGLTVFHRFYDPAAVAADPSKANTGLFFFRGRPGASFAIICPGGGFSYVGSLHEGFPYAEEISAAGYNAFVLRYRPGMGSAVATEDLAAALEYIRRHAAALNVSSEDYSLWGSSAGARMAAAIGSGRIPGPAAVIMAYTGHGDVSRPEPPTFALVGARDAIAPPSRMKRRVEALRRMGVPVEFHVIEGLGHGFGLGTGTAAEGWAADAIRFWQTQSRIRHLHPGAN